MHDFSQLSEKIELLQLSIDGKPIEHVKYIKFLGILFDENLTCKLFDSVIKLHTHTHYQKVKYKMHTYHGFSYNVKGKYLGTSKYECSNLIYYKYGCI